MEKFKVGDYVEAIRDHNGNLFKKGDRYTVLATRNTICKSCGKSIFCIDIGIKLKSLVGGIIHTTDSGCNGIMGIFTEIWFSYLSFKLVEEDSNNQEVIEDFKPITYSRIIEKVQLSVS